MDPEPGTADSGDLEHDLPELFEAVGNAAAAKDTAIAITFDEMQYLAETELSALILAVHRISQRQLPLVLLGAGLPQLVGKSGRSKSYAERLFDFPEIGRLNELEAREALLGPVEREGVTFSGNALSEVNRKTQGYPYFLQEWGYHSWNAAERSPIEVADVQRATLVAIKRLDEGFFRVRFDRLTPRERDYLRAMAELGAGPHRSGDIAALLSTPVTSIAPLRNGLIRKGMIYSPAHGDTAFTVPLFDSFMVRNLPGWTADAGGQ